jgi:predicted PurR-regulated permease PerM
MSSSIAIALWTVAVLASLFFLRAAKALLIPIALSVLISYALAPIVVWLERWRVPRPVGAALVLFVVLGAGAGSAYALVDDATRMMAAVPATMQRVYDRVTERLAERADDGQVTGTSGRTEAVDAVSAVRQAANASVQMAGSLVQQGVAAMFALAGHFVVIVFLIYFLLISGHHVRNRLVEIAGPDAARRQMTATIIDDINGQVQRYLLVLVVTSAIVGAGTWALLSWMRVENAAMWGTLAGIFNSIPYFGPFIVSGGLFTVGLAQGGGIAQAIQMSGAAILITSIEGWLITPALMGRAERMSALAVFLGLLLWTWVWGAWGTILAVPMLVVTKSVADHVDGLKPVGRLMAP